MTTSRRFLFLQGAATPFFRDLSAAIQKQGHTVFRVNFCGGDSLYSLFSGNATCWRFNQAHQHLLDWLSPKHQQHHFSDVVVFGDSRPIHQAAIQFFQQQGVRVYVYEEGYLRPSWITLEKNGVNGYSSLIDQTLSFWQKAYNVASPAHLTPKNTGNTFWARASFDIAYRLANIVLWPLYHRYRTHRPLPAYKEYAGWLWRFPNNKLWREKREHRLINELIHSKTSFYLFPLQLDSDAQIKVHSPFKSVKQAIDLVINSFAKHAPTDSKLLIKNHPLDTGLLQYHQYVKALVQALDLSERVIFIETGHLPLLLKNAQGTVLVNSTTGTSALLHNCPLIALGKAIFNIPGLTFQEGLDKFWTEAKAPDKKLYRQFQQILIAKTQINGDFYSRYGRQLAVAGSLKAMQIMPIPVETLGQSDPLLEHSLIPASPVSPISYGGKLPDKTYLYKKQ
ncbi:MAG: capsular biosynthesis protein [Proteobacteria bacterium]|nr:MAG: capsular biosynthesis protein [Pseudomonadota bacterium]